MCRHQISVDPRGRVYDYYFNQAIGLRTPRVELRFAWELSMNELGERAIATGDHCVTPAYPRNQLSRDALDAPSRATLD